jgi:hypothetical protein
LLDIVIVAVPGPTDVPVLGRLTVNWVDVTEAMLPPEKLSETPVVVGSPDT